MHVEIFSDYKTLSICIKGKCMELSSIICTYIAVICGTQLADTTKAIYELINKRVYKNPRQHSST
jgi:hypothetical protein